MSTRGRSKELRLALALGLFFGTGCGGDGESAPRDSTSRADGGTDPDAADVREEVCSPGELPALTVEDVVPNGSLEYPLHVVQPRGDDRLFVVEQPGRIRILRGGEVLSEAFLDLTEVVDFEHPRTERGLLGLAFHPDYASNGRFFVFYTPAGQNVLAEYRRSEDPDRADPVEVRRLIEVDDPEINHNGGMLAFGPDGFLYVGIGDGGGFCDRRGEIGNAQTLASPFGKLHRLDVDAVDRGFRAEGNPFSAEEAIPTVWAYGLRNPWRFSFDRATGDLYAADVGDSAFEEINFQPAESGGGENYGWRDFEGFESSAASGCEPSGVVDAEEHTPPVLAYALHAEDAIVRAGCAVIGGYVYRGEAIAGLEGAYLFGDFCSGDVATFRMCRGEAQELQRIPGLESVGSGLASFGQDEAGELYLVYLWSGSVKRIVRAE